ncbi:MAG: hypothetical protein JXP34_00465, partial [Planctomycetes bacterium]|nr:hypothetical protein [Planctomycetota bacterium]
LLLALACAPAPAPFPDRRDIFVPADEFARVLSRHPRGTFLDRKELDDLLARAAKMDAERAQRPPRSFSIGSASLRGEVDGASVRLAGEIGIDLLEEGPIAVPLRLANVPIRGARLDGADASFFPLPGGAAALIVAGAGRHKLEIATEHPLRIEPAGRFLEAQLPAGLLGSVEIAVPDRARILGSAAGAARIEGDRTIWRGALPEDGRVSLAILPAAEAAAGQAILTAVERASWTLGRDRIRVRSVLRLRAHRDAPPAWDVRLPAGLAVTALSGDSVAAWGTSGDGETQLRIRLARPMAEVEVRIDAEAPIVDGARALPALTVEGAAWQEGIVALSSETGDRLRVVAADGYTRADPPEGDGAMAFAYRTPERTLTYALDPIPTRLAATWNGAWEILPDRLRAAGTVEVACLEGETYALAIPVSAGYRVESADPAGIARADVEAGAIRVRLPDALRAGRKLTVAVALERDLAPDAWRNAEEKLPIPAPRGIERLDGVIGISAKEPIVPRLVSAIDIEPAEDGAWRISSPKAAAVFRLEEAPSRLESESVILAAAARESVRVRGGIRFDIRGRGRDEFVIVIRRAGSAHVEIEGDGIRERVKEEPAKEEGRASDQRWRVRLQEKRSGEIALRVDLEIPVADTRVEIPSIEIPDAARQSSWLAVAARDETEVIPKPTGLAPADLRELPPLVDRPDDERLLFAYRARPGEEPRLDIDIVRHEPLPALAAVIVKADLASFVSTDGRLRTHALLTVRNAGAEKLGVILGEGADLWSARVAGEGARVLRDGKAFAVPIPIPADGSDLAVEIAYVEPAPPVGPGGRLEIAGPTFDVPVAETNWTVHMPEGLWVWRAGGNVTGFEADPFTRWAREALRVGKEAARGAAHILAGGTRARRTGPRGGISQERTESATAADQDVPVTLLDNYPATARDRAEHLEREFEPLPPAAETAAPKAEPPRPATAEPEAPPTEAPAEGHPAEPQVRRMQEVWGYEAAARPGASAPAAKAKGILGLDIPREGAGRPLGFHRIGGAPRVVLRYQSDGRMRFAIGIALVLGAVILVLTRRFWRRMPVWAFAGAASITAAIPRVANAPVVPIANAFFYGALLVIAGHLLGRFVSKLRGAAVVLLVFVALGSSASGADPGALEVFVPYDPAALPASPAGVAADKVYLPEDTFRALWERAFPVLPVADKETAYGISNVRYEGRVDGARSTWTATFRIRVLSEEWQDIPIGLAGAALGSASLESGAPVAIRPAEGGHRIALKGKGEYGLRIAFEAPVARARGGATGSLTFGAVPSPAGEIIVRIPDSTLEPEVPGAAGTWIRDEAKDEVELAAAIGGRGEVLVRWGPAEAGPATAAGLAVEERTVFAIESDRTRIDGRWTFTPGGAAIDRATIGADPDIVFLSIHGPEVHAWSPGDGGGAVVLLKAATRAPFEIRFSAVRRDTGAWTSPALAPAGAAKRQGIAGIAFDPAIKGRVVEAKGLARVDPSEAKIDGGAATPAAGFRYGAAAWSIRCEREARRPVLTARARTIAALRNGGLDVRSEIALDVSEAPLYALRVLTGAEPQDFRVEGIAVASEVWSKAGDEVVLAFARGVTGKATLSLDGRYAVEGDSVDIPVWRPDADRIEATLGAGAEAGLRLEVLEAIGLEAIPVARLGRSPASDAPIGFAYALQSDAPGAARIRVRIEKLAPRVAARAILDAAAGDGVVAYRIEITGRAERAAAPELRFRVEGLGEEALRLVAAPPASELAPGAIRFGKPVLGGFSVALEARVALGASREVACPAVALEGCDEEAYFVRVRNEGPQRVMIAASEGLRSLAPGEWPGEAGDAIAVLGAARPGWRLALTLSPLEIEEGLEAVIDIADATTVILADGALRHRIRYRVINRREQFLALRLPEGLEIWSVIVDEKAVKPAEGAGGSVLIPLPKRGRGDLSFDVVAVFAGALAGPIETLGTVEPPLPAVENMEVAESFWRLYLPEGPRYFRFEGNMTRTVEAVIETSILQKAVQELEEIASIAETGVNIFEKTAAFSNTAVQNFRVLEQLERAEEVQNLYMGKRGELSQPEWDVVDSNSDTLIKLRKQVEDLQARAPVSGPAPEGRSGGRRAAPPQGEVGGRWAAP